MEKGYTIEVLDYGYVRYVDHMGSDQRIVEAARISYKSPSCWDLKNLLHFIILRDDAHAQWEHQQYGKAIK